MNQVNELSNKFEVIVLDKDYHKKGEDLESQQRWKLLDKEQSQTQEQTKFAQSNIIIGPGKILEANTLGCIKDPADLIVNSSSQIGKFNSYFVAYFQQSRLFLIASKNHLLVYNAQQFELLISADQYQTSKPRMIKLNTEEIVLNIRISKNEDYLALQTQTQIIYITQTDLVAGIDKPIIINMNQKILNFQWDCENTQQIILVTLEQNKIEKITLQKGSIHSQASVALPSPFQHVISGNLTTHIFKNQGKYVLYEDKVQIQLLNLELKIDHISQLHNCGLDHNYILCGYNKLDNEDEDEYEAVILTFKVNGSQVTDYNQTFQGELRKTSSTQGDFTILPILNKTLDSKNQVVDSTVFVVVGSNFTKISFLQLAQGKLVVLKRLKDESQLINTTTVVRGLTFFTQNISASDIYTGLALNGKFYLNYRIPTILCLNSNLQLIQYQLIDFNLQKLEALTNERQKYEPLLQRNVILNEYPKAVNMQQVPQPQINAKMGNLFSGYQQSVEIPQANNFFPSVQSQKGNLFSGTGFQTQNFNQDSNLKLQTTNNPKPTPSIFSQDQEKTTFSFNPQNTTKTKINNQLKSNHLQIKENYLIVESLDKDIKQLQEFPNSVEIEMKSSLGGKFVCGTGEFKIKVNKNKSANLLTYNLKNQLSFLACNGGFFSLNAKDIQELILGQKKLQDCEYTKSSQNDQNSVIYIATFSDLILVSTEDVILSYKIQQGKIIRGSWQQNIKNLTKIEFTCDGKQFLIHGDSDVHLCEVLHLRDDTSIVEIKRLKNINAVCFYNQGLLYQQQEELIFDDLIQQIRLSKSYQSNNISYLQQVTDNKVYGSYYDPQTLQKKTIFKEYIFQIDLQQKVVKTKDCKYFKDDFNDKFLTNEIDWNVSRLSLNYMDDGRCIKEGNFVVIFCNFLYDGYIFQVINDELIPLEDSTQEFVYLPSFGNLVKGLTFVHCMLPNEEKLCPQTGFCVIRKDGETYQGHLNPSLYMVELNQKDILKMHRFSLFNVEIGELQREKKNSKPLVLQGKLQSVAVAEAPQKLITEVLHKQQQELLKPITEVSHKQQQEPQNPSFNQIELNLQQISKFLSKGSQSMNQMDKNLKQSLLESESVKKGLYYFIESFVKLKQEQAALVEKKQQIDDIQNIILGKDPAVESINHFVDIKLESMNFQFGNIRDNFKKADDQLELIEIFYQTYFEVLQMITKKFNQNNSISFNEYNNNPQRQKRQFEPNFDNFSRTNQIDRPNQNNQAQNKLGFKSDKLSQLQQKYQQILDDIRRSLRPESSVSSKKKISFKTVGTDVLSQSQISQSQSSQSQSQSQIRQQADKKFTNTQQSNDNLWETMRTLSQNVKPVSYQHMKLNPPKQSHQEPIQARIRKNAETTDPNSLGDLQNLSTNQFKSSKEELKTGLSSFGASAEKAHILNPTISNKTNNQVQFNMDVRVNNQNEESKDQPIKKQFFTLNKDGKKKSIDSEIESDNEYATRKLKNTSVSHNLSSLGQFQKQQPSKDSTNLDEKNQEKYNEINLNSQKTNFQDIAKDNQDVQKNLFDKNQKQDGLFSNFQFKSPSLELSERGPQLEKTEIKLPETIKAEEKIPQNQFTQNIKDEIKPKSGSLFDNLNKDEIKPKSNSLFDHLNLTNQPKKEETILFPRMAHSEIRQPNDEESNKEVNDDVSAQRQDNAVIPQKPIIAQPQSQVQKNDKIPNNDPTKKVQTQNNLFSLNTQTQAINNNSISGLFGAPSNASSLFGNQNSQGLAAFAPQAQSNSVFGQQNQGGSTFGQSMFDNNTAPQNPVQQQISQLNFGASSSQAPQTQGISFQLQNPANSVGFNLNQPPPQLNLQQQFQNNSASYMKPRK